MFDQNIKNLYYWVISKSFLMLLALMSAVPTRINGLQNFKPLLALTAIFYYTLYRPQLFSIYFIVFLGLFEDIIFGTVLGSNALINLVFYMITSAQQKFFLKEPFWVVWVGFTLSILIICCINWLLMWILVGKLLLSYDIVMQWLLTSSLYPIMHFLFSKVKFQHA
jgi:rod shape-determining protein MreD